MQAHARRQWRSRSKRPCQMNIRASPCMCVRKLKSGLLLALKFTLVLCLVKASKDRCTMPPLPHALPLTFTVCICCDALVVGHVSRRVSPVFDEATRFQPFFDEATRFQPTCRYLSTSKWSARVERIAHVIWACHMGGLLTSCHVGGLLTSCHVGGLLTSCHVGGLLTSCPYAYQLIG